MAAINSTDMTSNFTMTTPVVDEVASGRPGYDVLRLVLSLPLLIMATLGNSLAFAVMRRKSMRNTSPGVYFAAIAVTDTLTVYWGVLPFLIDYFSGVNLWIYHPWSCKVVVFTLFTSADSALWLLVAITVDRFIAVRFPLAMKQLCTPKRALMVALALPSVATLKNFHLFFTRGRQVISDPDVAPELWEVRNCGFPSPAIEFFETYIRSWIAFALYAVIPIISVFILNIIIVRTLYKTRKVKVAPPTGSGGSGAAPGGEESKMSSREERARKSNQQLTIMFLSVSITFLILITPSITVFVIKPYLSLSEAGSRRYSYLESTVDSMAYLMHSSNFFLYCLTGAGFRRELKAMVGGWMGRKTQSQEVTQTEQTA